MTVLEQLRKTIEDGHPGETENVTVHSVLRCTEFMLIA